MEVLPDIWDGILYLALNSGFAFWLHDVKQII